MSDRWQQGQYEQNQNLRERVAVLERNLQYLQESITSLKQGQADNRAYTERSFSELMQAQAELKREIADLKIVVASRTPDSDGEAKTRRWIIGIGVGIAVIFVLMLVVWIRLSVMGHV